MNRRRVISALIGHGVMLAVGLAALALVLSGCTLFQSQQSWNPEAPLSKLELAWDTTVAARQWAQQVLYAMWDRAQDEAITAAGKADEFSGRALELLDEAFTKFEPRGERIYEREQDAYDLIGEVNQGNSKILVHFNTAPTLDWVWLIQQAKLNLDSVEGAATKLEKAIQDRSAKG